MSAANKFDLSSGSPDRLSHASGHRASYSAASLDRSASFRENMENPLLSNLPNMSRSSSSASQGDVLNFFQCVRFDPKSIVVEHKLNRATEFKQLASSAVGILQEDSLPAPSKNKQPSSSSPEDLRRLKSGVRESGTKARERVKILNDCLSVINKCFPAIPSRKRSRLDSLPNERPYSLMPMDRSGSGVGVGKLGSQNHASTSGFEQEQQKSDERPRNAIPNKRPRTSMVDSRMDVRANNTTRPSGALDKDKDVVRPNSNAIQSEERTVSIGVDGWEKTKMKKKRTGIKPDIAAGSMATKPVDGYREPKQGMQPWLATETRSRLTEPHTFRSGIANGGMGIGKAEGSLQSSSGARPSISRTDSDNNSLLHERRERSFGQEKERINLKPANKSNSGEDLSSGSPISGSKLNTNVRAPRSGSVSSVSKLSQVVQRSATSNDWEVSNCTSKLLGVLGANSRKRTPSARSSSPPVANWVQRPQKISRTARRTNLSPIIPSNEDNSAMDTTSDMMVNERHLPAYSPQQVKLKSERFSPAALSESEGSGATEVKSNKIKKCDELHEKTGQNVQKISTLLLPPRKNKAISGDEHGDGVRRQGRTGRGCSSSRSLLPLGAEKLGNVGTTKQIRSPRPGLGKSERLGRPPTRKLSDRKAHTRQKQIATNITTDSLVGSDDGHEELLAAANAVTNTAKALSSPLWKKMEPLFRFISDKDISYLKDLVDLGSVVDTPGPAPLDANSSTLMPNGYGSNDFGREESETRSVEFSPEHLAPGAKTPDDTSLFQRLLAAFIPEEVCGESFCVGKDSPKYDAYGSRFHVEKDIEPDAPCHQPLQNYDLSLYPFSNGYGVNINGNSCYGLDQSVQDSDIVSMPYDYLQNGSLTDQVMHGTACSDHRYSNMSVNERILVEVRSIGIFPDPVSDLAQSGDEEVSGSISGSHEELQEQALIKKRQLHKLLSCASEAKALQEKEFEGRALDKLVEMAYEKYMSCWVPTAHGAKSAGGKMAKQAALAFVKRALERCQEFEVTGKSRFAESLYKGMFHSAVSHLVDGQFPNSNIDNELVKHHLSTSGCSVEVRTAAPAGALRCSTNQEMYSSEAFPSGNLGSEQNTGKDGTWSNRIKRRELFLDDVGGAICTSPGGPSGLSGSPSCSAKGKRSERDREGKGNSRDVLFKSGTTKLGRPASANVKGERRSKAKPKQKIAPLSASVNGPLGRMSEHSKIQSSPTIKSGDATGSDIGNDKNDNDLDILEEPIDLSGLQLPGMDVLGGPDDIGDQGEDIGSWLNIEDDGLQDHDFMGGLEIPMDDLADLNMMV